MATSTGFDSVLNGLGVKRSAGSNAMLAADSKQAKGTLDQADFLKLMTAQLKNQDPFSPVDNSQMVAQMAQFSSLAGISEMSTTLKAIAGKLGDSASNAVSYIGRSVLTPGGVAYAASGGGLGGAIELDADASNVVVTISDANGQLLQTVDLGAQKAGTVDFEWDGLNQAGAPTGSGPFNVAVQARDGTKSVTARTLVWAPVAAVSVPATGPAQLTLPGLGQIPVTAVRKIG